MQLLYSINHLPSLSTPGLQHTLVNNYEIYQISIVFGMFTKMLLRYEYLIQNPISMKHVTEGENVPEQSLGRKDGGGGIHLF